MTRLDRDRVKSLLEIAEDGDTDAKGHALEELVVLLFEAIPGVELEGKRILDAPLSQEIDVVFRNNQDRSGLPHLPHLLFVECKNWGDPVGSDAVTRFATKIKSRGEDFGVLVTKAGISGAKREWPGSAYFELLLLLPDCAIVVLDKREIAGVRSGKRLAELVMKKWRILKTRRGLYQATDKELNRPEFQTGLREAIRAFRASVTEEFLKRASAPAGRGAAIDALHATRTRLAEAVRTAEASSDDPLWSGPRDALVDFGAAAVSLVLLSERPIGTTAEWIELSADLNGPARARAFVGGDLWSLLTEYYIGQSETASEMDAHSAALSLVELAINQVGQIDSIELEPEDWDGRS